MTAIGSLSPPASPRTAFARPGAGAAPGPGAGAGGAAPASLPEDRGGSSARRARRGPSWLRAREADRSARFRCSKKSVFGSSPRLLSSSRVMLITMIESTPSDSNDSRGPSCPAGIRTARSSAARTRRSASRRARSGATLPSATGSAASGGVAVPAAARPDETAAGSPRSLRIERSLIRTRTLPDGPNRRTSSFSSPVLPAGPLTTSHARQVGGSGPSTSSSPRLNGTGEPASPLRPVTPSKACRAPSRRLGWSTHEDAVSTTLGGSSSEARASDPFPASPTIACSEGP